LKKHLFFAEPFITISADLKIFINMHWIQSALLPFQRRYCKAIFTIPALITLGFVLYSAVVCGGFIFLVGMNHRSLTIASAAMGLAFLFCFLLTAGYFWELVTQIHYPTDRLDCALGTHWPQYLMDGFLVRIQRLIIFPQALKRHAKTVIDFCIIRF
jgi:hypothetical protein